MTNRIDPEALQARYAAAKAAHARKKRQDDGAAQAVGLIFEEYGSAYQTTPMLQKATVVAQYLVGAFVIFTMVVL